MVVWMMHGQQQGSFQSRKKRRFQGGRTARVCSSNCVSRGLQAQRQGTLRRVAGFRGGLLVSGGFPDAVSKEWWEEVLHALPSDDGGVHHHDESVIRSSLRKSKLKDLLQYMGKNCEMDLPGSQASRLPSLAPLPLPSVLAASAAVTKGLNRNLDVTANASVEAPPKTDISLIEKSINAFHFLAIDTVEKANSRYLGLPMGCAPMGHILYDEIMKYNPKNPYWFNRDGFVISAMHGRYDCTAAQSASPTAKFTNRSFFSLTYNTHNDEGDVDEAGSTAVRRFDY
ncbi:hypothetical protein L7F22_021146 [Adiantum nelumboides]|nr:hypothetical protein [Adiantum nelumboides]